MYFHNISKYFFYLRTDGWFELPFRKRIENTSEPKHPDPHPFTILHYSYSSCIFQTYPIMMMSHVSKERCYRSQQQRTSSICKHHTESAWNFTEITEIQYWKKVITTLLHS